MSNSHMAMPEVHEALDEQEIALCFPVVQTLRVHFTCQADFVSRVVRQQADGYHLMYIADGGQVQAIAGYRIREHLETPDPRYMYVADLATLPAKQGAGYGKALMARLEQIAREAGCKRLLLESGVQRPKAHKFYFNSGLAIMCYRFEKELQ